MRRLSLLVLFVLAATTLAADNPFARVNNPPKVPDDLRLTKPFHVDNPFQITADYKDKAAWEARAKDLREQVLVANGLWPMPARTALAPVIHGKIDRPEYTIEKVYFASLPGHYVCGNLYRPKKVQGKAAAVLCPHGHWANGRLYERGDGEAKKEIESGAEKTMEGARYPLQARCVQLAKLGCVVFFYDMVGYADSKQIQHTHGFADAEADLRLQSFMGLQTWNSIRALDFLTSLPEVDPKRIAVTGASGGGTQTFILGAVDDRPAVSIPAVMVSTAMQGGCICENCSLLRIGTNNIELAALFAPKPQAMTGANDWTVDIEKKGLPDLRKIYGLYGAADKVHAKHYPFPHNYNQVVREMMYNWVNMHLKLGHMDAITESSFTPVPPKELSVFDAEHPLPKDATDAAGTRKYLTMASDQQLAELAKQPEEYRRVVGAALRAMVVDKLPPASEIPAKLLKEVKGDGFNVHQTLLSRSGSSEQVPTIGVIPTGWKGGVVVWTHPRGKASLFAADGKPVAAAQQLLDRKLAIMAPDVYLTGEFFLPDQEAKVPGLDQKYHKGVPFAGYTYGYNRSVLANRAHDLLTVIAFAGMANGGKPVDLVAFDDAGAWALLARALAGDKVHKAAIDLNGFDFDQVKRPDDPRMLCGALKYGGVHGIIPLCTSGQTILFDVPPGGRLTTPHVTLENGQVKPEQQIAWLVK